MMKRGHQATGYVWHVMLLGLLLVNLMSGCAMRVSNEPTRYTDSQIAPGYGRLVFVKSRGVSPDMETMSAGQFAATGLVMTLAGPVPSSNDPRSSNDDLLAYNLFKVEGKSFIPLAEFINPMKYSANLGEIFYVDIPVSKQRFFIVGSKFGWTASSRYLVGNYTAIDIDVKEGQTQPIFFGPRGALVGSEPLFSIRSYPLMPEDVAFCYGVRGMNISDADRVTRVGNKASEYFRDPLARIKLNSTLIAVVLMQPAKPSDDFKKWAGEKQADLATEYAKSDLSHVQAVPYDVYKNADGRK